MEKIFVEGGGDSAIPNKKYRELLLEPTTKGIPESHAQDRRTINYFYELSNCALDMITSESYTTFCAFKFYAGEQSWLSGHCCIKCFPLAYGIWLNQVPKVQGEWNLSIEANPDNSCAGAVHCNIFHFGHCTVLQELSVAESRGFFHGFHWNSLFWDLANYYLPTRLTDLDWNTAKEVWS